MPTYDYKCGSCSKVMEVIHRMSETPEVECPDCKSTMEKQFSPTRVGFIIKGFTPGKAIKWEKDRRAKNADLGMRQLERYGTGPTLQPNVAGMEVDSWRDAQKVAKEAGMSAESYEPHIEKEKSVTKIKDIAWKAAKTEAGKI